MSRHSNEHGQLPDNNALPQCEGPKLEQFLDAHLPVEFIQLLSDHETAAHSHVFEVKIGAGKYALKVVCRHRTHHDSLNSKQFRFYDIAEDELGLSDNEIKDPDLAIQLDPFFAECRAFGRIKEQRRNGTLAIECLGYLYLPADREMEMNQRFRATDWDRPSEEYEVESSHRKPFRAIVKRLILEPTTWNVVTARTILRNLRALNTSGVYVFDVRARNILGGQLVDFSASWTDPHVLFRTRAPGEIESRKERDLARFDVMMKDLQIRNAPRGLPNRQYTAKLRSGATNACI